MRINTEIKAHAKNWEIQIHKVADMCGQPAMVLQQEDTYYRVNNGRLKIRITTEEESAVLVFYQRDNIAGPRESSYLLVPMAQKEAGILKQVLEETLGLIGVVRKIRHLFIVDVNRIHFDEVEGLGRFVEIEHVHDSESVASKVTKIEDVMKILDIRQDDLLEGSYADMLFKIDNSNEMGREHEQDKGNHQEL